MSTPLTALADDFKLNAPAMTGTIATVRADLYFLVDELGNQLIDEADNPLVGYLELDANAFLLHATADDFKLNAE